MLRTKGIATIPLSPTHSEKIGFYNIFVYVHKYAEEHGLASVFGINLLGKGDERNTYLDTLQQTVELLQICPTIWWIDESLHNETVNHVIQTLYAKELIHEAEREVSTCSCGKVEFLSNNTLRGTKTLVHKCRAMCCDSVLTSSRQRVLVTAPLPALDEVTVYPSWAGLELMEKCKEIEGRQLLVSRNTKRRYYLETSNKRWYIDNDISWWLYGLWLQKQNVVLDQLVIGASIIHQTCTLLAFSKLLGLSLPHTLHCLPKVFFQSRQNVSTISQAVEKFTRAKVVNALLWCALCGRKDMVFLEHMFNAMNPENCRFNSHNRRTQLLQKCDKRH